MSTYYKSIIGFHSFLLPLTLCLSCSIVIVHFPYITLNYFCNNFFNTAKNHLHPCPYGLIIPYIFDFMLEVIVTFSFWWAKLRALASVSNFEEIERFSKQKKSPIGYEVIPKETLLPIPPLIISHLLMFAWRRTDLGKQSNIFHAVLLTRGVDYTWQLGECSMCVYLEMFICWHFCSLVAVTGIKLPKLLQVRGT